MPDGLLIIDKPSGPTSHDVVARIRRALREKRIGHTGTLDPMATGVLLLVVGKATRLAKFLNASDKGYDATVRFGFATDTADAQGRPLGPPSDRPMPSRDAIEAALDAFRGTFLQQPPAFSAKKIDGQRSYKLARDARDTRDIRAKPPHGEDGADAAPGTAPPAPAALDPARGTPHLAPVAVPAPCRVTAHAIRIVRLDGDHLTLTIDCSAGFYIRSLAHDLGERLGIGAHLTALRRTRVGDFGLDRALTLDSAERDPDTVPAALVPLAAMLPGMGCVTLTAAGVTRALHGQDVRTIDHEPSALSAQPFVRLLDPAGELVAIAAANRVGGALHPSVVLV